MSQERDYRARVFVVGSFVAACSVKVDALPAPGETLAASDFRLEAGGKGFNLAVAARRLGAKVDGLLAIGDDTLGHLARPALDSADLPHSMLVPLEGPTGAGVGFIAADGETCLAVYAGANARLGARHAAARRAAIAGADLVLAQFETGDAPIAAAFSIAREGGRRTLLNPSPFRAACVDLLPWTSILCVNAVEAASLAASFGVADGDESLAGAVLARGPEALVVTAGAAGATAYLRDAPFTVRQPAFPVTAIDTLGAGDAFAAGLAVALAEGAGWSEALRLAAACGALTTTAFGVFDALPTREAAERMATPASDRAHQTADSE
ncbi:PfkB family carbohydrate kinase [Methylopila sp. M107]|uniref:PfkB family carbohydrate kinase n=1 Tax=Methylopila sp. M107 TaxID=1101190 RepID=UPI00037CB18E|nr:PfkB family carbohydrate kinase [Methylopila sp. M107]